VLQLVQVATAASCNELLTRLAAGHLIPAVARTSATKSSASSVGTNQRGPTVSFSGNVKYRRTALRAGPANADPSLQICPKGGA